MSRNVALNEDCVFCRVKTAGDILRKLIERAAAQVRRILARGYGVHIHDAVVTVIGIRQLHPVFDCAEVRPEGQFTRGLDSAENGLFFDCLFVHLRKFLCIYYSESSSAIFLKPGSAPSMVRGLTQ